MQPKIVVAMIVKNEQEMLTRCLSSVKEADAIYIVDTGSEDETVKIAKQFTENVFEDFTWCDDFAKARNHVLSKVKEENAYVLSIDADEFLHDFAAVRKAVNEADQKGILAIDVALEAENDGQIHYYPRLFKKNPQVWWEGAVHNHISVKPELTSQIKITYGYSPAHLKDPNRSFRILQKEVERTGNAREIYYLGREYWYRRQYRECVETLGKYVQKAHFLAEKADAFLLMARCYWAMGMGDDARDACVQALIINSNFKEAALFMATLAGFGSGNPEWEKNATQWQRMGETADNSGVLFIRDSK